MFVKNSFSFIYISVLWTCAFKCKWLPVNNKTNGKPDIFICILVFPATGSNLKVTFFRRQNIKDITILKQRYSNTKTAEILEHYKTAFKLFFRFFSIIHSYLENKIELKFQLPKKFSSAKSIFLPVKMIPSPVIHQFFHLQNYFFTY